MHRGSACPQEFSSSRVTRVSLRLLLGLSLCMFIGLSTSCKKQKRSHSRDPLYQSQPTLGDAGKSAQNDKRSKEHLPRLNQLAQADQPKDTPLLDSGVVAAAAITRVWLPADQTINNLWREVSTTSLSDAELLVWHRNQLRAAVVSKEKLNAILARLPAHFGVQQQIMTLSGDLVALDPANSKAAYRPVSVEVDGQAKIYSGGRLQLLVAANHQDGKSVKLTFVPHQYVPRVMLLPRPQAESALDGVMFSKLLLRVLIAPGQVLLIAPDVPLPVFDDTRPVVSTEEVKAKEEPPRTTQPAGIVDASEDTAAVAAGDIAQDVNQVLELPELSTEPESKRVPYGLGQAVLSGYQARSLLYQLLIFEVQPLLVEASSSEAAIGVGQ